MVERVKSLTSIPNDKLKSNSQKIEIIQALRGVAIIMVVGFHFTEIIDRNGFLKSATGLLFNSGAAGVDLFFIISGFIMVFVTKKSLGGFSNFKNFLLKRFLRIWPLYAVATISYAFINNHTLYSFNLVTIKNIIRSLLFIPMSYDNPPFFGYAYLSVGWSLNYEIYFYLLIAITMLFGRVKWLVFAVIIGITLVFVPFLYGNLEAQPFNSKNSGFLLVNLATSPIIWDFVYGVIIGLLFINPYFAIKLKFIFQSKLLLITILIIVIWQYLSGFYGGHGPFYWGFFMALLFLSLIFYDLNESIKCPVWLIYLGNISFSLYLWHIPIRTLIVEFFKIFSFPVFSIETPAFLLSIALAIIGSHISHQLLEIKLHDYLLEKTRN